MQEEDLLITPSTGLAFEFKSGGDQMKASDLTSAASKIEATMQFRIKVLINCEPLYKGDLLTRAVVKTAKKPAREAPAILPSQLIKRMKAA